MKPPYVVGLVAASILITVAIEETRLSALRQSSATTADAPRTSRSAPVASVSQAPEETAPPVRTKNRPELAPAKPAETDNAEESFAKTARKMFDNPAGKSMMNQQAKMAVAMLYEDFVTSLSLSKEESDYFKNILGKQITDQQELGMKMMGASDEERKSLAEEMKNREEANTAEIKKFLNNDADIKAYDDYKNHLPEHQQLDGIRSAMTAKGAPLDPATEAKLVDAMYRARTETKGPDLSGAAGMDALSKGTLTDSFEKNWEEQQEKLRTETSGILSPDQQTALMDFQKQAKEMQMMGLKMAEKMMSGKKDGAQ